ncbi:28S ribosomal protein S15, mitochondrial [Colletes gigas]|uniref:28S ribosomal protein S15, mitochondrial n=1 Tax=Colletes gigas TaxID=935657 RepID=UPI001C9B74C6|nr:28S ribosomal protein S15, mitochondrial [Colletes gigas]XP_043260441.1 28S ribosomal protein S15, mitochondrial [Colletes gigas]
MNFPTFYRLTCARMNNTSMLGGYVTRNIVTVADHKIKWVRPPRIPEVKPEHSGDLELNVSVKPTDTRLYYEQSKEWDDASDIVKNMFTLKHQRNIETRNLKREKTIALVKRHICDRGSAEAKIAAMTSEIQHIQEHMEQHPRNKPTKQFLKELIDKRKKQLKLLRKWDYRRYEWVLERLNLVYKPDPEVPGQVSRKESLRILTQQHCDNIIQTKLNAYKDELNKQKKDFYLEKAEKLAFILKEEKECGLEPSVTEEEIEALRKKVEEL